MHLVDFFGAFELTFSQKEALSKLDDFFESDVPCFLLKGFAGTGKTFLLKGLVEYLKAGKRNVVLTAPTGRAAQVLAAKTGFNATTIHRMLYFGESMQDTAGDAGKEYDIFKMFYGTSQNGHPTDTIYISDEASMISNVYSENDLMKFGSGYLMNDLITFIWPDPAHSKRKLIFVGDTAQLPPVDMNTSPALDAVYLKNTFNLACMEHELTQVVRQKESGGILQNATMLRRKISENRFGSLRLEVGNEVLNAATGNLAEQYLSLAGKAKEEALVVAYSNNSVYAYNLAIREHLYPGEKNPVAGDRLVVVHNNYLHGRELLNGEIGTLVSVNNEQTHVHQVLVRLPRKVSNDETEYKVTLRFREALIRFTDASGMYDIACMIMDNVLLSGRRDLTYLENVALLVDFKNRWAQINKQERGDFRTALRGDPFFNAVRVKFGYALTCHKAQGGEWKHVFVNCATGLGYNNEYYFRWLYTAITRARETLLLINAPSFNQTRLLREAGAEKNTDSPGNTGQQKEKPPFAEKKADASQLSFQENLALQLLAAANTAGYVTNELKHLPYCIQFTLSNDKSSALIRVHFSAKLRVTSIEGLNGEGEAGPALLDIFNFLNLPAGDKVFHPQVSPVNSASGSADFLLLFRQRIEKIVAAEQIQLIKVESHPWQEIYFFESGIKYAAIIFNYNKKKQFTRFQVIPTQTSGLEDILIPLIKNMDL